MAAATGPYHYVWKAGTDKDIDGFRIYDSSLLAFLGAGYLVNDPVDDYGVIMDPAPTKYFIDIYGGVPSAPVDLPSFFARAKGTTHEDLPPDPRIEPFAVYGDFGPLG